MAPFKNFLQLLAAAASVCAFAGWGGDWKKKEGNKRGKICSFPHVVFFHRKCWLAKVQAHLQPLHVSNATSTPPLRGAGLVGEGTAGCRDGLHSPLAEICYFPCYFRNNNYSFTSVHHCWRATSVFDLLHCWCYCLPPPSLIEYRQWTGLCTAHGVVVAFNRSLASESLRCVHHSINDW